MAVGEEGNGIQGTVQEGGQGYISNPTYENGKVTFSLSEDGKKVTSGTTTLQVELTGFTNYKKVTVNIPVVINEKDIVDIALDKNVFTYGDAIVPKYTI